MSEYTTTATAGRCAVHGGLMWDNKRVCLTPDDVIRGGCIWEPMPAETDRVSRLRRASSRDRNQEEHSG